MDLKSIIGATCISLLGAAFNINAAVISADWQTAGDNLVTQDTVSNLEWLDITVTTNWSYNNVVNHLGTGGRYESWRVATAEEVVGLWSNFGINLNVPAQHTVEYIDPGVAEAVSYIGNQYGDWSPTYYPYGALGMISDGPNSLSRYALGAYNLTDARYGYLLTTYIPTGDHSFTMAFTQENYGTYLVRNTVVPIPAAVWLFGSGLIGLVGFARLKKA